MNPPARRPVVTFDGGQHGTPESLGASPRPLPRPVAGLIVVLALLVLVAVLADGPWRRHESGLLAARAVTAQQSIDFTDRRIAGTVRYVSPQLTSSTAPPEVRADLQRLVQQAAAERVGPLQERRASVAGTRIAPWHGQERRARSAVLAYLDERLRLLEDVSTDLTVLYEPTPVLTSLRVQAASALSLIDGDELEPGR